MSSDDSKAIHDDKWLIQVGKSRVADDKIFSSDDSPYDTI